MSRKQPGHLSDYRWFHAATTRWMDNDVYGHVNNVVYFSYFDTAVSLFEVEHRLIDLDRSPLICVAAEAHCQYHRSVSFPDRLRIGLRCARIGTSSVRYELGVFRDRDELAAAEGHFVHVFVERETMRPAPLPEHVRAVLQTVLVAV